MAKAASAAPSVEERASSAAAASQQQQPGVFVLCDTRSFRFPIRYASQGFTDLYGLSAAEVLGQPCGDVCGGPAVKTDAAALAALARSAGLTTTEAAAGLDLLTSFAGDQCQAMLLRPKRRVGFALLVNRTKSGVLFTCELLMVMIRLPRFGWCYAIGMQRDISQELSPEALLGAAVRRQCARLVGQRRAALKARLVRLGAGSGSDKGLVEFMHRAVGGLIKSLGRTLGTTPMPTALVPPPGQPQMPSKEQEAMERDGDWSGVAVAGACADGFCVELQLAQALFPGGEEAEADTVGCPESLACWYSQVQLEQPSEVAWLEPHAGCLQAPVAWFEQPVVCVETSVAHLEPATARFLGGSADGLEAAAATLGLVRAPSPLLSCPEPARIDDLQSFPSSSEGEVASSSEGESEESPLDVGGLGQPMYVLLGREHLTFQGIPCA